jgi:23S rRNA pseudouridine2605 synthase
MSGSEKLRLQKQMAHLGIASRRECERMISAGRVSVNGKLVTEMGTKVNPADRIAVDGHQVQGSTKTTIYKLHKPAGYVTSTRDEEGRPTVYDLLPKDLPFLSYIGRLDFYTEGVLLMTNDGDLSRRLLLPSNRVPRVYVAKIQGQLNADARRRLRAGVPLDGRPTLGVQVEDLKGASRHDWVRLTLHEGRNRHVRRILEAVGHHVRRLIRVSFAGVDVDDLSPGTSRRLTNAEVAQLQSLS